MGYYKPSDYYKEYNGAFVENYVATELVATGESNLFYWKSKNDSEVDYIIQKDNRIYPLEVKSGTNRNKKSLRSYADKFKPKYIIRTSPRNFTQDNDFINISLYAVSCITQIF